MSTTRTLAGIGLASFALMISARVAAQDALPPDRSPPETDADSPSPPPLPAPTLEEDDESAVPDAPSEDETPPEAVILYRVGLDDQSGWQEEQDRRLRHDRDVPFEVPSDTRTGTGAGGIATVEPEQPPKTFSLAVGAGFARWLATEAIDFARVDERFTFRVPGFEALQIGAGAMQMIGENDRYMVGGGLRLAYGAGMPLLDDLDFEFVVALQPGVLAGTYGTYFDLHADLDLRLEISRVFQVMASGGFSLLGTTTVLGGSLLIGFVF